MTRRKLLFVLLLVGCRRAPGMDMPEGDTSEVSSTVDVESDTSESQADPSADGDDGEPSPPQWPPACREFDGRVQPVHTGDFDGDGADDVVVVRDTEVLTEQSVHLLWGPDWCSAEMVDLVGLEALSTIQRKMWTVDIDDDDVDDFVGWSDQSYGNAFFSIPGRPDRDLAEVEWQTTTVNPGVGVATAYDIDLDGQRELLVSDGLGFMGETIGVLEYSPEEGFWLPTFMGPDISGGVTGLGTGDYDGDGLEDLFIIGGTHHAEAGELGAQVVLLLGSNLPELQFVGVDGAPGGGSLVVEDLNGDGLDDVWIDREGATVFWGTPAGLASPVNTEASGFDPCMKNIEGLGPTRVDGQGTMRVFTYVEASLEPGCESFAEGVYALEPEAPGLGLAIPGGPSGVLAHPGADDGPRWVFVEYDEDAMRTALFVHGGD